MVRAVHEFTVDYWCRLCEGGTDKSLRSLSIRSLCCCVDWGVVFLLLYLYFLCVTEQYVDPKKMEMKGEIPFSDQLWVELRNDRNFIINVPKRKYQLEDINCNAKHWADILTPLVIDFREGRLTARSSSVEGSSGAP